MKSHLGIFFCALALLQIVGGHWALLQTTAWMGMIVEYGQKDGLAVGLAQTFDGDHPCAMCLAIKDGKKQEQKKTPLLQSELKKDFLSPDCPFQIHQSWVELKYSAFHLQQRDVFSQPIVPPPRLA